MRRFMLISIVLAAGCATTPPAAPIASPTETLPPAPAATAPPAAVPVPAVPKAPPPKVKVAADLTDHFGDSIETAVPVPKDATNEGVDFQNRWMFDRYGRFRRLKYGMGHAGDRRYDVITIELPDHSEHTVYFDITELWSSWKPTVK